MPELKPREIFDELFSKRFRNAYLRAYSILVDDEDAKDAVWQAFELFLKKKARFSSEIDAARILMRDVGRISLALLKRRERERGRRASVSSDAEGEFLPVRASSSAESGHLGANEARAVIDEAFHDKDELREIYCMKAFWGLTIQEIAMLRAIPLRSAKSKLYRARILVRNRMESVFGVQSN